MPRERFLAKLHAYQTWYAAGGHTRALGMRLFRVLTVTKSVERMRSLLTISAAAPRLASRLGAYWFATSTDISFGDPGRLLGSIWHTAAEPERSVGLLPVIV